MQRVAEQLGFTTMALYRHVPVERGGDVGEAQKFLNVLRAGVGAGELRRLG